MAKAFAARVTFAVPAGAGAFAPEVLDLTRGPDHGEPGGLSELTVYLESLPAGASLELDLLKPGGSPLTPGDWIIAVKTFTVVGLAALVEITHWYGARLRAKSNGVAGNLIASVGWR